MYKLYRIAVSAAFCMAVACMPVGGSTAAGQAVAASGKGTEHGVADYVQYTKADSQTHGYDPDAVRPNG